MNAWQRIYTVFEKELRDNLRDRRSMVSALASALIGPVILLMMIVILGKTVFQDGQERAVTVPVLGADNAASLVTFLEQNGAQIVAGPENPEAAVRNGDLDLVLVIPEGFGEDFRRGMPAPVQLITDSSRQSSQPAIERVRRILDAYDQQIGTLRLVARGISPAVIHPIVIEDVEVSTPQSQAVVFLNMMPYFIVLVVFVGGMYVIIDTTAGERERGSLEPLLINPVPRWELVVGKLAASLPFAILAVILTLLAFALAFNVFPIEDYVGMQVTLGIDILLGIFLISLPMVLFASALQMIVATFTRSFKEAQTYVAFLPLIPALPGIGLAFMPIKPSLGLMLIPTFGQQMLINQLMRGEPLNVLFLITSAACTLLVSALLILVAIKLYQREQILFSVK